MEAGDQVVAHVKGREAAAQRGVDGIDGFGQSGRLVDGLGPRVTGQHFEPVGAMVDGRFECVVGGVGDGALQFDAAEGGAKLSARGLLIEGSAGRAEAETEGGVGGVRLFEHQEMMRGCADIAERDERGRRELALHAQHPVLGVGGDVFGIDSRDADEGLKLAPVDACVGVGAAGAEGYFLQREALAGICAGGGDGEGRSKERRRSGGVGVAVGGVGAHDARRETFVCRIKRAIAKADAGLACRAGELLHPWGCGSGRPCEADARSEVVAYGCE